MEFFNDNGTDPLKPSLFELIAQEQLRDLLQPALKYVLAVFAQRYPRYLLRIVNQHEEFYALIMLFVERHYLRNHSASFSENFYGIKRRRRPYIEAERAQAAVGGLPAGERLRNREITLSLIFLVGIPYLRAKAYDYFEELGGGLSAEIINENQDVNYDARQLRALADESWKGKFRRTFKRWYPFLNTLFELWLLGWNVGYLFDYVPFYRPWLAWIGVDLRRLGIEDFKAAAAVASAGVKNSPLGSTPAHQPGIYARLSKLLTTSPQLLFDSLRLLLPTAIFFIKFLEWWYSPHSPARSLSTSSSASAATGPPVPPPKMLEPHPNGIRVDNLGYGMCGLCQDGINNATAFPSGYVFCYRCAYEYVAKHEACPVTLLPTKVWQLRKVLV